MPIWELRDDLDEAIGELELAAGYTLVASTTPPPPPSGAVLWSETFGSGPLVDVVVPSGQHVHLDVDVTVRDLRVEGLLEFEPAANLELRVERRADVVGRLEAWPLDASVTHTIDLACPLPLGGDAHMMTDPGMHVHSGGVLHLQGAERTPWIRTQGAVAAGDDDLGLASPPVGWLFDDELVLTPTSAPDVLGFSTGFEELLVDDVVGDVVVLSSPVGEDHPVAYGWSPEVLNLTRNVEVVSSTGNGHVMFHTSAGQPALRYVAFDGLGPDVFGRYPVHFHKCRGNVGPVTFPGVVVRNSGNRAFVTHGTDLVVWDRAIAYNVQRTPYWWDRGDLSDDSNDVLYSECVAALVTPGVGDNGFRLTGFDLGDGDGNGAVGCVSTGVQGSKDAAGFGWPEADGPIDEDNIGVWLFAQFNVAHNNRVHGIFTWQNTVHRHIVEDFACYHNGGWGIDHGAYGTRYLYTDGLVAGNADGGVQIHSSSHGDPVQEFRNLDVRDTPIGFWTRRHNLPGGSVDTLITDAAFTNVPVPFRAGAVVADNPTGKAHPDLIKVTNYDGGVVFDANLEPGWRWTLVRTDGTVEVLED